MLLMLMLLLSFYPLFPRIKISILNILEKLILIPFKNTRILVESTNILSLISQYRNTPFTKADSISEWRGDGFLLVGLSDNELVGFLRLDERYNLFNVSSFIISPKFRGLGYSKLFLTYLLFNKSITLRVKNDNEQAIQVYEKQGFKILDRIDGRLNMIKEIY